MEKHKRPQNCYEAKPFYVFPSPAPLHPPQKQLLQASFFMSFGNAGKSASILERNNWEENPSHNIYYNQLNKNSLPYSLIPQQGLKWPDPGSLH